MSGDTAPARERWVTLASMYFASKRSTAFSSCRAIAISSSLLVSGSFAISLALSCLIICSSTFARIMSGKCCRRAIAGDREDIRFHFSREEAMMSNRVLNGCRVSLRSCVKYVRICELRASAASKFSSRISKKSSMSRGSSQSVARVRMHFSSCSPSCETMLTSGCSTHAKDCDLLPFPVPSQCLGLGFSPPPNSICVKTCLAPPLPLLSP